MLFISICQQLVRMEGGHQQCVCARSVEEAERIVLEHGVQTCTKFVLQRQDKDFKDIREFTLNICNWLWVLFNALVLLFSFYDIYHFHFTTFIKFIMPINYSLSNLLLVMDRIVLINNKYMLIFVPIKVHICLYNLELLFMAKPNLLFDPGLASIPGLLSNRKVRWQDNSASKGPHISPIHAPYLLLGSRYYECHQGPKHYASKKAKVQYHLL